MGTSEEWVTPAVAATIVADQFSIYTQSEAQNVIGRWIERGRIAGLAMEVAKVTGPSHVTSEPSSGGEDAVTLPSRQQMLEAATERLKSRRTRPSAAEFLSSETATQREASSQLPISSATLSLLYQQPSFWSLAEARDPLTLADYHGIRLSAVDVTAALAMAGYPSSTDVLPREVETGESLEVQMPAQSLASAEGECVRFLHERFEAERVSGKKTNRETMLADAQLSIKGLSKEAFKRARAKVAPEYGRLGGGTFKAEQR